MKLQGRGGTNGLQEFEISDCGAVLSNDLASRDSEDGWESVHFFGDGGPGAEEMLFVLI
jgi:hypothetical protein